MAAKKQQKAELEATAGGAELVLVGPVVALAKHAYDAWKSGQPAVAPDDPLTFGVRSTVSNSSQHVLEIVCSNLGAHGTYVESVRVQEPDGITVVGATVIPEEGSINKPAFSSSESSIMSLPVLVPSAARAVLKVVVSQLSPERIRKKPFGKLAVAYTVAGVARPRQEKSVEFAVRLG